MDDLAIISINHGIQDNFWAASVIIHERKHFSNRMLGIFQDNTYISNQMDELSAYLEAAKWTGTMEEHGFDHFRNVTEFFYNMFKK